MSGGGNARRIVGPAFAREKEKNNAFISPVPALWGCLRADRRKGLGLSGAKAYTESGSKRKGAV